MDSSDDLIIAGRHFTSRLMVGTGKFPNSAALRHALDASGAEIVTVALRRVDLAHPEAESILPAIDRERRLILPNTSGARTADEAVRLARLARASGLEPWIKLELTPEARYLLPDPLETLRAAERLVAEGFVVLPYIQADPVLAKRLEEAGTATVMPWAPIEAIAACVHGYAAHHHRAVEHSCGGGRRPRCAVPCRGGDGVGADAVLVNTALSDARDHGAMARAFAMAVAAGRMAYLAGLGPERDTAEASSPLTGFLFENKDVSQNTHT